MMIELFTTKKYDNKIVLTNGDKKYSLYQLKMLVASEMEAVKSMKKNVVITGDDNFSFVIQFFASVFCEKNIYLVTDKTRLKDITFDYDIIEDCTLEPLGSYEFPKIDIERPSINFYTSGSSGTPKIIQKSIFNLIREAEDIGNEFQFKNNPLTVISTTTMCHLFGLTFHLMTSLCNGLIIDTQNISYSECVNRDNTILVSTPTFLSSIVKFKTPFITPPKYIITAGSKLNENIFEYLEHDSNIIEIYGSTETGVIAYKTHYNDGFIVFPNVTLIERQPNYEIVSDYFYERKTTLNDQIKITDGILTIGHRTDRIFKILEKRVSAEELEEKLKQSSLTKDCYITKQGDKLACLVALSEEGQEYLLKNNIVLLTKTLKQFLHEHSEIIPQKWKYIDEIPMTPTGKINKQLIEHVFNVNVSLPVILDRNVSKDSITYKIFLYRQCNFFKGHFPEFQLVPGVLQLYMAKEFANAHFHLTLGQGQYKRIKFSNIIEPDSIINLRLEKSENSVSYEYFSESKKYASGVFLCNNVFEGILS